MEVLLKVVMLLCFIILPLFPARRGKGNKSAAKEHPEISNYGVAEDGHIILIDEEERKKVKDNRHL